MHQTNLFYLIDAHAYHAKNSAAVFHASELSGLLVDQVSVKSTLTPVEIAPERGEVHAEGATKSLV
jgi:hypothetical protein